MLNTGWYERINRYGLPLKTSADRSWSIKYHSTYKSSQKRESIVSRQKAILNSLSITLDLSHHTFHTDFLIPIRRSHKFPHNSPLWLNGAYRVIIIIIITVKDAALT